MAGSASKQRVLEQLAEERAYWEGLLAEIPEDRMDEPGAMGDWTMKDCLAHLVNWWRFHVARIAAAERGEPAPEHLPQDEVQVINAWVEVVNRDRPVAEVLRDAREVWDQLQSRLRALPDDVVLTPGHPHGADERGVGSDVVELTAKHLHEEHEADIRVWLERVRRKAA